jgi:hypothetical protein
MNRQYILLSILSQLPGAQYLDNFTVGCTPGTQPKYLSSQRGRDRCISQSHGHSTEVPLLSACATHSYRCISQSHGHSTEVPLLSAWTRPVYLTVSRALNRSTSPLSVDATGVSHHLTGTQPKYLSSQRMRPQTGVSHSLTGTQPKYLFSQRGRDRCISPSHGHSTEVPLLSAWTRPVYLTVSRALNRSTSSLSVDATGVSHRLTGTQPKYLSSQHGCLSSQHRTANRCISQSHGHTTEVTLHSVWTRPVYPWALHCVH